MTIEETIMRLLELSLTGHRFIHSGIGNKEGKDRYAIYYLPDVKPVFIHTANKKEAMEWPFHLSLYQSVALVKHFWSRRVEDED